MQPDHRTGVVAGILGARHLAAIAKREVEEALAVEHQARPEMLAPGAFRALPEEDLDVLQLVAGQPATRDLGAHAVCAARRVGEIDDSVLRECGVEGHVHQAALPVHRDLRQAGDRLRVELRPDMAPPGLFVTACARPAGTRATRAAPARA